MVLLHACSRLSPRMIVFMLRRMLRNRLATVFRNSYQNRLGAIEDSLPKFGADVGVNPALERMAEFYCAEYQEMADNAGLGKITLYGKMVDFKSPANVNWNHYLPEEGDHQMWRIKLAHMGYVCPMLVSGETYDHAAVSKLVDGARRGTDMTAAGAFGSFWFPYAASHRLLAIGSGLIMARSKGTLPLETDAAVVDFLRLNAAFVLDNIEHELLNNHVERNLAALCLYFSCVDAVPTTIAKRLERDIKFLVEKTVLGDGTQVERSPMYQGLSVASLDVMAQAPFLSKNLRQLLLAKVKSARRAFAILCHPDGKVALFNDAWHGEVPPWQGPKAPDGRSLLAEGGYGRLSQGNNVCLMDAGPIGPSWNPGHGHADFLSLEISLRGERVVVDPGTSRYNTGAERARERSAAAHNGPIWQGFEPVEFLSCFKVGRMAAAQLVEEKFLPADTIAGLFCSKLGVIGRMVRHYPGVGFLVADLWVGKAPGQVTWLVPASWGIVSRPSGFVLRNLEGNMEVFISSLSPLDAVVNSSSHWANSYSRVEAAHKLCFWPRHSEKPQSLLTWIGCVPEEGDINEDGMELLSRLKVIISKT